MDKVYINGIRFKYPTAGEVSFSKHYELFKTKDNEFRKRLSILMGLPDERFLKCTPDQVLALYTLVQHVEELPIKTTNKVEVPPVEEWEYRIFEFTRLAVKAHPQELGLTLSRICYLLDLPTKYYLEVGVKALNDVARYMEKWEWSGLFNPEEPDPDQVAAGLERLSAFGAYGILNFLGEKYGVKTIEVEKWKTEEVIKDWVYSQEKVAFNNNLQEIKLQ